MDSNNADELTLEECPACLNGEGNQEAHTLGPEYCMYDPELEENEYEYPPITCPACLYGEGNFESHTLGPEYCMYEKEENDEEEKGGLDPIGLEPIKSPLLQLGKEIKELKKEIELLSEEIKKLEVLINTLFPPV